MLPEERRADEGKVAEDREAVGGPFGELLLGVLSPDEGREAAAEEAEGEAGRVLVRVEPDDHGSEAERHEGARGRAGDEGQPVASRLHAGGEARDGGDEHHALGAKVHDARALVDQQAQRGQREGGAGVEGGGDDDSELVHRGAPSTSSRSASRVASERRAATASSPRA